MRHTTLSAVLAAAASLPVELAAQSTWRSLPALPPTFAQFYAASFDTTHGVLHMNDTGNHWLFDGVQWQAAPAVPL